MRIVLRIAAYAGLLSAVPIVCLGVFVIILEIGGPKTRQWFSLGPLGLRRRSKSKPRPHGVLRIGDLRSNQVLPEENWKEWARSLPRSARRTMLTTADKYFAENNFHVRTVNVRSLSMKHLYVTFDHQVRMYGRVRGIIGSILRFLVARNMVGIVDEYWQGKRLVAWSHTICKGNTVRGMWFYQLTSISRSGIWFWNTRLAVQRAFSMPASEVDWVDCGPSSNNPKIEALKSRYGFTVTRDWCNEGWCDYNGPFRELLSVSQFINF